MNTEEKKTTDLKSLEDKSKQLYEYILKTNSVLDTAIADIKGVPCSDAKSEVKASMSPANRIVGVRLRLEDSMSLMDSIAHKIELLQSITGY